MLKVIIFFALLCTVCSVVPNCMNPWQTEMKTTTTPVKNVACTATNSAPCAKGRDGVCVFTYVTFNYICCENIVNISTPICPKYYDTLAVNCDPKSANACPYNYQCLPSVNTNYTVCCTKNPNKVYPEPSSSFVDLGVTPKYLPIAPTTLLKVNTYKLGQNVPLAELTATPTILFTPKDNVTYYSLLVFDISATAPAASVWMAVNARMNTNNRTLIDFVTTPATTVKGYAMIAASATPLGEHVIVFAVFEQTAAFATGVPATSDVPGTGWDVASFLTRFKTTIGSIVAGTYITVTTA